MPRYRAKGSITRRGADFIIDADDIEAARAMFEQGSWDDWDDSAAETSDWDIDITTIEEEKG
jgi:hypothetical protein